MLSSPGAGGLEIGQFKCAPSRGIFPTSMALSLLSVRRTNFPTGQGGGPPSFSTPALLLRESSLRETAARLSGALSRNEVPCRAARLRGRAAGPLRLDGGARLPHHLLGGTRGYLYDIVISSGIISVISRIINISGIEHLQSPSWRSGRCR